MADEGYYSAFEITENGLAYRQKAIAEGYTVDFTRGAIGEGRPVDDADIFYMTGLVSPVMDVPIKESYSEGKNHIMAIVIDGTKLTADVMMTEIAIFVRLLHPDTGEELLPEILYGYTYTKRYDYIPAGESYNLYREIAFNTILSRDGKFEVVFDKSKVYTTFQDVNDMLELTYAKGIEIPHYLNAYPSALVIEFDSGYGVAPYGMGPFGGSNGRQVRCLVEYLNRNAVKVSTGKNYGTVESVTEIENGEFIITFTSDTISLYVKLFTGAVSGTSAPPSSGTPSAGTVVPAMIQFVS